MTELWNIYLNERTDLVFIFFSVLNKQPLPVVREVALIITLKCRVISLDPKNLLKDIHQAVTAPMTAGSNHHPAYHYRFLY
jgi:hypothetical protein